MKRKTIAELERIRDVLSTTVYDKSVENILKIILGEIIELRKDINSLDDSKTFSTKDYF